MDERLIFTPDQRVRVFISSTLNELAVERQTVKKCIKDDLRLHPIMFEAGASPHPPRERYRAFVEQSQIYVGIFWESYGWIAPDMDISGIEDEYNIAMQLNIPRLVYKKRTIKGRDDRLTRLLNKIEEEGTICFADFETPAELEDLIKDDVAIILSERFGLAETLLKPHTKVNYLDRLSEVIAQQGLVARAAMLSEVENALDVGKRLLLVGEPGCGKTFLLGKLGVKLNGIYVSIRDKTPLEVYAYVTNCLRTQNGQSPQKFTSNEDAKTDLENLLQTSKTVLLVDDLERNGALAEILLGLDYYQTKVIFASRSQPVGTHPIKVLEVSPFSRPEIEMYLSEKGISLPPSKFLELMRACHGNPLYLYFFTSYQIEPLPEGLTAYQDSLWRELDAIQRELLGLMALSFAPLKTSIVCDACNRLPGKDLTLMEVASSLSELSTLVTIQNGLNEIFHPYFKESIEKQIIQMGLSKDYHRVLGEAHLQQKDIVAATFHFVRAADDRADDYLFEASHGAFSGGMWKLAEEFLERAIEIARKKKDFWSEGYAHYHLSFLLHDEGLRDRSQHHIEQAITSFEKCGDQNWIEFSKIQLYLNLISAGNSTFAIDALKELLNVYEGVDPTGEAMLLVNLSFAYIQVSHFEQGAETAKKAYEIFAEEGDFNGITTSLLNLIACLSKLELYDLAKKYIKELMAVAEDFNLPRLKAGILNHLAIILRKGGDPQGARKCLEETIEICQRLGSISGEILNILNLGNTYKDDKDFDAAMKCYEEGLAKAKSYGIAREEGRALELMGAIERRRGNHTIAIEYVTEAIEIQEKTGDSLRIAESLVERAKSLQTLEKVREAAQDYQEAGDNYVKAMQPEDAITSYERASSLWVSMGEEDAALRALEKATDYSFRSNKIDLASSAIRDLQASRRIKGLSAFYLKLINKFVEAPATANLSLSLYSFASYCKLSEDREIRSSYFKGLQILAENASRHRNICSALMAGIEQADDRLLTEDDLENLSFSLSTVRDDFHYRKMPDGMTIWTAFWKGAEQLRVIQLQCLSERLIEKRLSLVLLLVILAEKELFYRTINELSGFKESSMTFMILGQEEFEKKVQRLPADLLTDQCPAVIMQSGVPYEEEQPPMPIVIHKSYGTIADWSLYPQNKALVWLLMLFFSSLVEHFAHRDRNSLAKRAREFCEMVFGYRAVQESSEPQTQDQWAVENIAVVIEKIKRLRRGDSSDLEKP
jgi:tetratricopeptide (TPR) repeat protein